MPSTYRDNFLVRKRRTKQEILEAKRLAKRNQEYAEEFIQEHTEEQNEDQIAFADQHLNMVENEVHDQPNAIEEPCSDLDRNDQLNRSAPNDMNANREKQDLEHNFELAMSNTIIVFQQQLYDNSTINRKEALQLLQLFRQNNRLPDAAFGQMLSLLKYCLLPENNSLPRTLYSFNKALEQHSIHQILHRTENFVVYDIRLQLTHLIKKNFASFIDFRRHIESTPNVYDYCGDLMRDRLNEHINLALLTDGGALTKSTKISVWPIIGQLLDLPPKLEKTVSNMLLIAVFVGSNKPNWHEIFAYIIPQIKSLQSEEGALQIYNYRYKIRILEFIADNKARADVLRMREPPCYFGCSDCKIQGQKVENSILYQHETVPSPRRIDWIPEPGQGPVGNGINEISPLAQIMDLPKNIQIDMMHTTYSGSFQRGLIGMYSKNKQFFDSIVEPKFKFVKPTEIKRSFGESSEKRTFEDIYRMKTNELRMIAHFVLPVILPDYGDLTKEANYDQCVNMLILCDALAVLASYNLTKSKIDFAKSLFIYWHKTLPNKFDQTYKAHLHLHLAEKTRNFGASTSHTCFFLESCVGYIISRVTYVPSALKQIEERIKLLPCEDLDELSAIFSNKKRSTVADKFEYSIRVIPQKYQEYLRAKHGAKLILASKSIKLKQFEIKSRLLCQKNRTQDSIIYVESKQNASLKPAVAELFYKVEDSEQIWLLGRSIIIEDAFARSLRWATPTDAYNLLTDQRSFPDTYIVTNQYGEIGNIDYNRIICKGLMVKYNGKRIVFTMNVFDHD